MVFSLKECCFSILLAALLVLPSAASVCQAAPESASRTIFAMDTVMTLQVEGEGADDVITDAVKEIQRLDAMFSTGNAESEVGKLNAAGHGTATIEMQELFGAARDLNDETDGAFDITVYPAMQLWGFPTQEYHVPTDEELEAVRPLVDMDAVIRDDAEVSFAKEGMAVDFGGIAKGYTSSRIHDMFEEKGMVRGLINLGGNVHAFGSKEGDAPWRIAIRDPWNPDVYLGVLEIRDVAVITSGAYERYFEEDGKRYHHILDPQTLRPAENGMMSVSIVSRDGTMADGLSTSLFVMGLEKAEAYWRDHAGEFECILVTEDENVYITEGLEGTFTTDYPVEVIRK